MALIFCLQYCSWLTWHQTRKSPSPFKSILTQRIARCVVATLIIIAFFLSISSLGYERGIATSLILAGTSGSLNVLIAGFVPQHHSKSGIVIVMIALTSYALSIIVAQSH